MVGRVVVCNPPISPWSSESDTDYLNILQEVEGGREKYG